MRQRYFKKCTAFMLVVTMIMGCSMSASADKMDLVHYRESEYKKIEKEIKKLAIDLDLADVTVIPVSATEGDNVTRRSEPMKWYQGPTLLGY